MFHPRQYLPFVNVNDRRTSNPLFSPSDHQYIISMQDSSPASSSASPTSFLLREREAGKLSCEHLTVTSSGSRVTPELDQSQLQPTAYQRMFTSCSERVAFRHPRVYSWIKQVVLYVRGPRPKEDLPRMLFPLCQCLLSI